ncbi:hypothetical protein DPMN_166377 [Dreissena polymorpha]|uniref:Uncharacterized protein n=1 Tax=Dreissena polymorpha TaxID=45954 RepID=A0A9D4IXJ1_DREPO|nr:hypothetical protein DPMN_166377 [Dreissena polymorpha]
MPPSITMAICGTYLWYEYTQHATFYHHGYMRHLPVVRVHPACLLLSPWLYAALTCGKSTPSMPPPITMAICGTDLWY